MKKELDEDGYLLMEAFSDDDLPPEEAAAVAEVFADPPPLSDGDWLTAVAAAVSAPVESAIVDDDEVGDADTTDDPSSPFAHPDGGGLDRGEWSETETDESSDFVSHAGPGSTLRDDEDGGWT
jgi:hypothetical protein